MAKVGFWLKGANGKLSNTTIYQQNGETLIREVVTPSNPQTEKQTIQRIIMHTVMQSYSKMKAICDHSFEGLKKGQATMSYYMSQNVGFAREKVASMQAQGISFVNMYNFVPLGIKGFTPNQYQVSMGSLPRVDAYLRDEDTGHAFIAGLETNTYEAVINQLGLQRGDQLTFLVIDQNTDAQFGQCNFHYARVILDPTDPATYQPLPLSTPFVDAETHLINAPSVRNEGNFYFGIEEGAGLAFCQNGSLDVAAAAVIVSRKMNDKWLRSTAYLTYNGAEEYSMQNCIDAVSQGTNAPIYAADSQYLNNAGEGNGAAVEAGGTTGGQTGGGGSVEAAAISSASIDGASMIMGTNCEVTKANGTTFPYTAALNITTNAAANGKKVKVYSGVEVIAQATIADGAASVSHAWAKDTTYVVKLTDADDSNATNTGYSFVFNEATASGGGGFDSGS